MARIIIVGLGPLGVKTVRFAVERRSVEIVGAVDINPALVGKDLGEHCGLPKMGVVISPNLRVALKGAKADCAVLTTVSSVATLESQVADAAKCGLDVVSTCEELSFPWRTAPAVSRRMDAVCRKHGVTCLGTGVNPGFLMDFLPCILTAVNQNVRKVIVQRVQDASVRRIPFQQKIGTGLTLAEFRQKKAAGTLRHVGLTESVHMIAHAMNWKLTKVTESLKPVMAGARLTTGYKPIAKGKARGVEQIGRGFVGGREVIKLHFRAAVGEPRSFDRIEIKGQPDMVSEIDGGVNGDIATCAIVLNAVRSVIAASPGLKTMLDVPAVAYGG
ncbi:MAG: dihydrodipicolinate reductase [Verrucomicrobia bacterium]|nr:dihydrodipicolinate reductase [Verrucomicrobiota bacterium]